MKENKYLKSEILKLNSIFLSEGENELYNKKNYDLHQIYDDNNLSKDVLNDIIKENYEKSVSLKCEEEKSHFYQTKVRNLIGEVDLLNKQVNFKKN